MNNLIVINFTYNIILTFFTMKKLFLIISLLYAGSSILFSQSNIGIVLGGGVSDFRIKTDSTEIDKIMNTEDLNFRLMYQAGFNFENVLIERQLYLQFSFHAGSSGFSSHNDSLGMYFHTIHIPLEMKYKHFFNKRGEGYVFGSAGPYVAISYKGIQYDFEEIDNFIEDTDATFDMYNPKIKLGKSETDDIMAFDYGINIGAGFGYANFQIAYNFGLGLANMIPTEQLEPLEGEEPFTLKLKNSFHSVTLGFFFSNK